MESVETDGQRLYPANLADANDIWCVFHDISANELSLKTYDDSGDSWAETSVATSIADSTTHPYAVFSAAVRHSDGHLLVAAWSEFDTATADLLVWDITDSGTITAKTNVSTNVDDMGYVALFINQQTDEVYVAQFGINTGGNTAGTSWVAYYYLSDDGMATWGAQTPYSTTADDYRVITAGHSVGDDGGWFMPVFFDDDDNDIFVDDQFGVEIPAAGDPFTARYLSTTTFTAGTGTTIAAQAKPFGVAVGDCIVALMYIEDGGANGAYTIASTGDTWVSAGSIINTGTTPDFEIQVWYCIVANAISTVGVTWDGSSVWRDFAMGLLRGIDATTPLASNVTTATGNSTTATGPSVTTTEDGAHLVFLTGNFSGVTHSAQTSPLVERNDSGNVHIASGIQTSAGASGGKSATLSASDQWAALLLALRPAGISAGGPTGAAAATFPALTAAATGTQTQSGTGAATFPSLSAAASGYMQPTGDVAATFPALTAAAEGTHTSETTGTAAATFPGLDAAATGTQTHSGAAAATFPSLEASASGVMQPSGAAAATFPALTAAALGSHGEAQGAGAATFPSLTGAATGSTPIAGAVVATFPSLTAAAVGSHGQAGAAAATFPALGAASSGVMVPSGAGAATFPSPTADASGTQTQAGSAAATFPAPTAAAIGVMVPSGTGAATFPALVAVGAGTSGDATYGVAFFPALTMAAYGRQGVDGATEMSAEWWPIIDRPAQWRPAVEIDAIWGPVVVRDGG